MKKFFELLRITFLTRTCTLCPLATEINISHPDPEFKEKINLDFYFHTSLSYLKRFYEGCKDLHKTFRDISKISKNRNLS